MQIIDQTNSSPIDGTNSIEERVSIYQNSRWLVILPDLSRLLKIQRTITERVIDPLTWIDHVLGRLYAGVYGSQRKPRFWCLWQNALRWNQSNNSTSHDEHYNKRALRSSGSYRRSGRFLMIQPRVFRRRKSWLAVNLYRLQIKNVIGSCSFVTAG